MEKDRKKSRLDTKSYVFKGKVVSAVRVSYYTGKNGQVKFWGVSDKTGMTITPFLKGPVNAVAISPDRILAVGKNEAGITRSYVASYDEETDKDILQEVKPSESKLFYNGAMVPYFTVSKYKNKSGKDVCWTVYDQDGNVVLPLMVGEVNVVAYDSDKCIAVGKDAEGNQKAFAITHDSKNNSSRTTLINNRDYDILHASPADDNRLLLKTSKGYCFADTKRAFEPNSDFYDELYKVYFSNSEKWIYEKVVRGKYLSTTIAGQIDAETGCVAPKAWDSLAREHRDIYTEKHPMFGFDVIDTHFIKKLLADKEEDDYVLMRDKAISLSPWKQRKDK